MRWDETEHCRSHVHCAACPYVIGFDAAKAEAEHVGQLNEAEHILPHWEAPVEGTCPEGVGFDTALVWLRMGRRGSIRHLRATWTLRLLRIVAAHVDLPAARVALREAVGAREVKLWLALGAVKALENDGVLPADTYLVVARDGAEALLTAFNNDMAYYALRNCVEEQAMTGLTAAQAHAIADDLGITEPAGV